MRFKEMEFFFVTCAVFLAGIFFSDTVSAQPTVFSECVGRYSLKMPGDYEVAYSNPEFRDGLKIKKIRFSDGEEVPGNSFYLNGEWDVSPMSLAQFEEIKRKVLINFQDNKNSTDDFKLIPMTQPNSIGWSSDVSVGFEANLNGTEIQYYSDNKADTFPNLIRDLRYIDKNLSPRAKGEVPDKSGVCLPGVFVAGSNANEVRSIGTAFRLKDHPDVTISFYDNKSNVKLNSKQLSEFTWTSSGLGPKVKLIGIRPYRAMKIANREGIQSFGEISRNDGSTDYAYVVTVAGKTSTSDETSDLRLLVLRTARNAHNHVPVSDEKIESIGEYIASSIRHLP